MLNPTASAVFAPLARRDPMFRKAILPTILLGLAYAFYASPTIKQIAAGVAVFLFGMLFLEDGFRSFTGGGLETVLRIATNRLWKSVAFGVVTTTIMQSSSLVSVLTISFLSAGLLGLTQGVGIVFGANLGTTTGAWLVAGLGLKVKIAAYAMPMLVFGVILVLQKSKKAKGVGYVLAGLGFLFLGIHFMKEGFEAFKENIDLAEYAVGGVRGLLLFTLIGIVATVVMQSSHATLVLIITALAAKQVTYDNALALAIGSNVGTTITAIIGALGTGVAGRRLAGAHLVFNAITGLIALIFIQQFIMVVDSISAAVGIPPDEFTLKLAVFHSLFNLVGLIVMLPAIKPLVGLLHRVLPDATHVGSKPRFLNASVVDFPETAVTAVRNETLHMLHNALHVMARGLELNASEVFGKTPLEDVAKERPTDEFDLDEAYDRRVKGLHAEILAFISRIDIHGDTKQGTELHLMRQANRHVVEAVKAVKHLRKNLVPALRSRNKVQRAEYNRIRISLARVVREIHRLTLAEAADGSIEALESLKVEVEVYEQQLMGGLDELIRGQSITPRLGTSLMNDSAYATTAVSSLMRVADSVLVTREQALHIDDRASMIGGLGPDSSSERV